MNAPAPSPAIPPTIRADYLLERTTALVDKMIVYPERVHRNIDLTRGLVFSGQLAARSGGSMLREEA